MSSLQKGRFTNVGYDEDDDDYCNNDNDFYYYYVDQRQMWKNFARITYPDHLAQPSPLSNIACQPSQDVI